MTVIDTIKLKLDKAKAEGAVDEQNADALIGIAEGLDDEALYQLFKTGLTILPEAVAMAVYWLLVAFDPILPEHIEEMLYLDELKAAAQAKI